MDGTVPGSNGLRRRLILFLLAAAATPAAWAQSPRAAEVWGNAGVARAGGDEGSLGSGVIYGGGVSLPFTGRLAFEADVAGLHADRFASFTRVLVSPAVVVRWGSPRVYGFVGGGPGLQDDSGRSSEWMVHVRGGFVARLAPRILLRTEVFSAWHYVLPTVGVKFGAGYRF